MSSLEEAQLASSWRPGYPKTQTQLLWFWKLAKTGFEILESTSLLFGRR